MKPYGKPNGKHMWLDFPPFKFCWNTFRNADKKQRRKKARRDANKEIASQSDS